MKPLLLALALLLGGVLTLQWRGWAPDAGLPSPPPPADAAGMTGPAPSAVDPLALEPPPKEDYASVVERPLFLPERRPPPDEPEDEPIEEEPATDLAGVDLTAVVITPAVVSAWVRSPQHQELKRLRLGDDYEGWTVQTIEPARLVLERQGETNELPLRDYANAPPPIPRTRLPPRRATGGRPESAQGRGGAGEPPAAAGDADNPERQRGARPPQRAPTRQPRRPARAPTRQSAAQPRSRPRNQPPSRANTR